MMDKILINGGKKLKGTVTISGSKNSTLPIIAASILSDETSIIKNVPMLSDVKTMLRLLENLGVKTEVFEDRIVIKPNGYTGTTAPYKLVATMRASFCLLGPLLGKQRVAEVSLPGGCIIGPRPVDLHLKGLKRLGADIKVEGGYVKAKTKRLTGNTVYLGGAFGSSVLATANVMMASTLAKGKTVIENAACEPEVVDLADFLIKMGARINGHGSNIIEIEGVNSLHGAVHSVIPDRIETATYIIAAAITGGDVIIKNARAEHLGAIMDKLYDMGISITKTDAGLRVKAQAKIKSAKITTLPYPGFPTDVQAQVMALSAVADGITIITEKIYPERFMHVAELNRMGADINLEGQSAIIRGVKKLSGAPVMASDLRASAALVLAGLVAKGTTEISRIYHLDRGYVKLEEKLSSLGADIKRVR